MPEGPPTSDVIRAIKPEGPVVRFQCGHYYDSSYALSCFGETFSASKKFLDARTLCGDCQVERFKRTSTRCAICGMIILPGARVALYPEQCPPKDGAFAMFTSPNGTVFAIGCLRDNCQPFFDRCAGRWTEEGFKPDHPDGLNIGDLVVSSGKMGILSQEGLALL